MRRTLFAFSGLFALCLGWFALTALSTNAAEEYGKAGYYSDSLHGRKTANGEKYDKAAFTCAHKTLPFGTKLRVTRLDNKKSVIVRVNDRGPFTEGFVVDLSRKAAESISLIRDGVTRVRIERISDADMVEEANERAEAAEDSSPRAVAYSTDDPSPLSGARSAKSGKAKSAKDKSAKASAEDDAQGSKLFKVDLRQTPKEGFGVQVTTLYDADNVLPVVTKLQKSHPGKVLVNVQTDAANDQSTYRVIIGPFGSKPAAAAQQKIAAKNGYKESFVVDLSEM